MHVRPLDIIEDDFVKMALNYLHCNHQVVGRGAARKDVFSRADSDPMGRYYSVKEFPGTQQIAGISAAQIDIRLKYTPCAFGHLLSYFSFLPVLGLDDKPFHSKSV